LEQIPAPSQTFTEWSSSIEITDSSLEHLLKTDLKTAIQQVLESLFEDQNIPLRAFTQNSNTFYLYDNTQEWRKMKGKETGEDVDEFGKFINKIEHKFRKKYNEWAKEHQIELSSTPQAQEKSMIYMAKVNGLKQPNRISEIKIYIYSKMAVSLKQVIV
jgi:hypothetical protein